MILKMKKIYIGIILVLSYIPIEAQIYQGPIFDAHLHYNIEAYDDYPVEDVLEKFKVNNVKAFLSNSRTNNGTKMLADEIKSTNANFTTIIPFIRLYRNRADYTNWFRDNSIYEMVLEELKKGTSKGAFVGIGEFHLYESVDGYGETAKKLMELSVAKDLVILAHVDADAIEILMSHAPTAKVIWAHSGISGVPIERVELLLNKYPSLMGELSYRPGLTLSNGLLTKKWESLLLTLPNKFLVGSDTWTNSRWENYSNLINSYRFWLGNLPPEIAKQIAWGNGAQLFNIE